MGDVIGVKEFKLKGLQDMLAKNLVHDDPLVLEEWKRLACEALEKFPGPPGMDRALEYKFESQISDKDIEGLNKAITEYGNDYKKKFENVMLSMLFEIVILQKEVAEARVGKI